MGDLDVKELIDETDKVFEFPMCDRGTPNPAVRVSSLLNLIIRSRSNNGLLAVWTLLGDAAHPMYPSE